MRTQFHASHISTHTIHAIRLIAGFVTLAFKTLSPLGAPLVPLLLLRKG